MRSCMAESVKAECEEAGSAFFMKQMAAASPSKANDLIPITLKVRQWPDDMDAPFDDKEKAA